MQPSGECVRSYPTRLFDVQVCKHQLAYRAGAGAGKVQASRARQRRSAANGGWAGSQRATRAQTAQEVIIIIIALPACQ